MKKNIFYLILVIIILTACNEKQVNSESAEQKNKLEDTTGQKEKPFDNLIEPDSQKTISVKDNRKLDLEKNPKDTLKIDVGEEIKNKQSETPNSNIIIHKVKVGQIISFDLFQNGSTGFTTKYSIDNSEVLLLMQEKREANDKYGYSAYLKVVLEVKKAGTCNINIKKNYRGKLVEESIHKIIAE